MKKLTLTEQIDGDQLDRALKSLDAQGRLSHRLAIEAGKADECCRICPRVFLAHLDTSIVDCSRGERCAFSPSRPRIVSKEIRTGVIPREYELQEVEG